LWFKNFRPNNVLNLRDIESTIKRAGYYRADLSNKLTVLQMNSQYVTKDDETTHDGELDEIIEWL